MNHFRAFVIAAMIACFTLLSHAAAKGAHCVVIIHGAWGGAHHWKAVDQAISEQGHFVKQVSHTGLGERSHLASKEIDLQTHVPDFVQCHYWLLTDGKSVEKDQRHRYYQRAQELGWTTRALPWNHNPQRERPEDLTRELLRVIEEKKR